MLHPPDSPVKRRLISAVAAAAAATIGSDCAITFRRSNSCDDRDDVLLLSPLKTAKHGIRTLTRSRSCDYYDENASYYPTEKKHSLRQLQQKHLPHPADAGTIPGFHSNSNSSQTLQSQSHFKKQNRPIMQQQHQQLRQALIQDFNTKSSSLPCGKPLSVKSAEVEELLLLPKLVPRSTTTSYALPAPFSIQKPFRRLNPYTHPIQPHGTIQKRWLVLRRRRRSHLWLAVLVAIGMVLTFAPYYLWLGCDDPAESLPEISQRFSNTRLRQTTTTTTAKTTRIRNTSTEVIAVETTVAASADDPTALVKKISLSLPGEQVVATFREQRTVPAFVPDKVVGVTSVELSNNKDAQIKPQPRNKVTVLSPIPVQVSGREGKQVITVERKWQTSVELNNEETVTPDTKNETILHQFAYAYDTKNETILHKFAYAYVVGGCMPEDPSYRNYFNNIMVSTFIQREEGSRADVVLLVQMAFESAYSALPDEDLRLLKEMDILIQYIPKTKDESFYRIMLDKFLVLGLTQYSRVLFMDGDVLARGSLDYMFELSVLGVLKKNVIMAGQREPANGGFFMVEPGEGAWERIISIIANKEERGANMPYPHWDEKKGWGHAFDENDYYELINNKKNNTWNFYGAFADQGLLYHWTKYEGKSVSIVFRDSVQNWDVDANGKVYLEQTLGLDIFDNVSVKRECWLELMKHNPCKAPHSDYIHFTGKRKPWLRPRPIYMNEVAERGSPQHYWFDILKILNHRMEMGLDFENWKWFHRPLFGMFPRYTDAAQTRYVAENDKN